MKGKYFRDTGEVLRAFCRKFYMIKSSHYDLYATSVVLTCKYLLL